MSTKKITTNQYAPAGMNAYNQVIPQAANVWSAFMQNPLQNSFFQQNQQLANNQIGQGSQSQLTTMLNNMRQLGVGGTGGSSPFLSSMLAQQGRGTSAQMSNSFMQNLLGTNQLRMSAANSAGGFNPLATGQTGTTGGLGSWLPQLAGTALGALSGGGGAQMFQNPFGAGSGFGGTPPAFQPTSSYGAPGSPFNLGSSPISGALTPPQ